MEQAEVDGQPQSITPVTTEIFQSDYKELLKTIGDTYIPRETVNSCLTSLTNALNSATLGGTLAFDDTNMTFSFIPAS